MAQQTPVELAANSTFGAPDYLAGLDDQTRGQWADAMAKSGIDINSEQAKMLAEQQFGGTLEKGTFSPTFDADLAMTDPTEIALTRQSAMNKPTTTDWMDRATKGLESLLSPTASTGISQPAFITSVASSDLSMDKLGSGFGTAGQLGLTPEQRQLQAQLVAQIEQQQELARRKAQAGWGIA